MRRPPAGRERPARVVDERGGGPISTWFGFSVFLVLLLFATQLMFNLYAASVVTAVSYDAARRVAAGDGGPGFVAQAEADARQTLGRYAGRVSFDWSGTTTDEVVLRVEASNPNLLLPVIAGRAAFDHLDRTGQSPGGALPVTACLKRDESGQAGIEAVPFALLTFVIGSLIVVNAWAVIDAKIAVSAAAREATRAYVEAPADADPLDLADIAARAAVRGAGRDSRRLSLTPLEATFARCGTVRFEASYQLPAIRVPWLGGLGTFTARGRHAEVVDPFRTGVPRSVTGCAPSP